MTYKNVEIDKPTVEMIQEYIDKMGFFNLSAESIFKRYEENGWLNSKGKPIKKIEIIVNVANGVDIQKRKQPQKLTYNGKTYEELLKTEEWKTFRNKVLELHQYKCDVCNKKEDLRVHHKLYRKSNKFLTLPWAYFYSDMQVLCEKHHKEAHKIKYYQIV